MGRCLRPLLAALLSLGLLASASASATANEGQQTPAYIALGDSIAFGVGASTPSSKGYVGRAFAGLSKSERYRDRGLTLVNLSASGATSADLLVPEGQLDKAIAEIERRSEEVIMTLNIGGNDLLGLLSRGSPCVTDAASDACSADFEQMLSDVQANLREVLERLRDAAPEATIIVVDLYNPYSGTADPREAIADFGVAQVNAVSSVVSGGEDLRVKTAATYRLFLGRGKQWIAGDGIHPNDSGHAVIAEVVLSEIEGRPSEIPAELLVETPAPVATGAGVILDTGTGRSDSELLVVAVAAFFAGGVVSGAFFALRGRPR